MQKVTHDIENHMFWVDLEHGFEAKVVYQLQNGAMHITSTVVPEQLRGKGCGKMMMESVLPEIESLGYKVVPVCPYVVYYFDKNKQWAHLLA